MQIKPLLQYFKDKNYLIVEADLNVIITVVNKEKHLIITHTIDGRTMIAHKTDKDIRFVGKIVNIQQLKMVLDMVLALIE